MKHAKKRKKNIFIIDPLLRTKKSIYVHYIHYLRYIYYIQYLHFTTFRKRYIDFYKTYTTFDLGGELL